MPTWHVLPVQTGEPFATTHVRPHEPQLLTSDCVFTSQPSTNAALPSASWSTQGCVVEVVVVLVVVVVGTGTGAQRRLDVFTATDREPNWSCTVTVGCAFGHFTL